ncbi:hypothetical protein Salat_1773700 [Sesamum alatum]|uniref:Uncharacterized protein n=1 Tax=Sesamum alatum TaxID=300844 RepID=A0AAE1Y961_9LAMI|nr:hypothetical protein Salat_1773700 [Sesamum alatum]
MQAAEALFSVESQSSMNLTYHTQARKRTITSTRSITQDSELRRSTRLNAPVTGGEYGMNSMPIPAAFKPPRPAPIPTQTVAHPPRPATIPIQIATPSHHVPRCVVRPPVPFAPGHPNVAISITTNITNHYHHLSKYSRKIEKKYVTMNNLTSALNVRRAEKCSKGQSTKNT